MKPKKVKTKRRKKSISDKIKLKLKAITMYDVHVYEYLKRGGARAYKTFTT